MEHRLVLVARAAQSWVRRYLGDLCAEDMGERSLRCAEEAMEACQAFNVPKATVHKLLDRVYSRPMGAPSDEVFGTLFTALALFRSSGMTEEELSQRLREMWDKEFAKVAAKHKEKVDAGVALR